jgi:predicted transcriptional regulator
VTRKRAPEPKADPIEADAPVEADGAAPSASTHAKKERVLHTRIPAVLEQELKRFADNLRIPVSNLVRTILEDAVSVADVASSNVEAGLKSAAAQLHAERERLRSRVRVDPLKGVYAFQDVTLAQKAACVRCRTELGPGTRAHLGLTDTTVPGAPRIFVCGDCVPRV